MHVFVVVGFSKKDLFRLNIVCLHQQALFLVCVLGTSGEIRDAKYTWEGLQTVSEGLHMGDTL